MIVTRQRKQKKNALPILLPIAAIVMLVVALSWPPSRNFITNGPLHPVATVVEKFWGTAATPLTFAYQQQQITDRNREVKRLNDTLETDRKAAADKDAQLAALRKQIAAAQTASTEASPAPSPSAAAVASAAGGGGIPGAAAPSPADAALKLTGQQWSSMDPENAAKIAQKLPVSYDSAVFAQMSPDSVGPIMDALPPTFAAQIIQSSPQAQISAQTGR
jgi:flagellar motility protein MotE (MotC chaperone)